MPHSVASEVLSHAPSYDLDGAWVGEYLQIEWPKLGNL